MAYKKKKKPRKNYKAFDLNSILLIAIIFILIYGVNQGWFGGSNYNFSGDQIDMFNTEGTSGTNQCKITLDKSAYCSGDWAKATLSGPDDTLFYVGLNQDDAGWEVWGEVTTDSSGNVTKNIRVTETGKYKIRAISDYCITNLVEVEVIDCGTDPDEENCWWQSIAKENDLSIMQGTFSNWFGTLVEGKFKYAWSYSLMGPLTEISHALTVDHTSSAQSGSYEFNANSGETWQISTINAVSVPITADLELFQWVCEGDDLNWNPNMYGGQGQYTPEEKTCDEYCQAEWGMYGYCGIAQPGMQYDTPCIDPVNSYYLANIYADEWCEENLAMYGHCCCSQTQLN